MRNVLSIFKNDMRLLTGNFWAMVVLVFCMILPALYAWVNIYANWDPYGNTSGVKIAVVSNDKDYIDDDGERHNVGEDVIENLKESTSIGWQFMDDTEEALDGVYSGAYYAAIIIDENFTYNMFNFLTTDMTSPTIRYYVNSKTNAIAVKITDTAASTLKQSVAENYLKVIIGTVFEKVGSAYQDFEAGDPVNSIEDALMSINNNLDNYKASLAAFKNAGTMLQSDLIALDKTVDYAIYTIAQSRSNIPYRVEEINSAQDELAAWNAEIDLSLSNISGYIQTCIDQLTGRDITSEETVQKTIEELEKEYNELIHYIETHGGEEDPAVADALSALRKNRDELEALRESMGLNHSYSNDDQAYANSVNSKMTLQSIQADFESIVVPSLYKYSTGESMSSITQEDQLSYQSIVDMSNYMMEDVMAKLDDIQKNADAAVVSGDASVQNIAVENIKEDLEIAQQELNTLNLTYSILGNNVEGFDAVELMAATDSAAQTLATTGTGVISGTSTAASGVDLVTMLEMVKVGVDATREAMTDAVYPALNNSLDRLKATLGDFSSVLLKLSDVLVDSKPLIAAMGNAVNSLNDAFTSTEAVLESISDSLTDLLEKIDNLQNNEQIQTILDFLGMDPDAVGEFLAEPVETVTETVYPVANYGSGMTPFYSALAIWVGSVVLCAVIKTKAVPVGMMKPTMSQLFFGRYLTFLVFAILQAIIILLGDMLILGCQCLHPGLFLLAGVVTSFVFSMLIFSLTLSFGDVGKAIIVVIMIVQIAGSSGSFPIELLPEFFQKVYIFFPFPYAINAMRECIAGLYQYDYWRYLGELMIFAVVGLGIALVLRKPFVGLTEYLEEKAKGTQMM